MTFVLPKKRLGGVLVSEGGGRRGMGCYRLSNNWVRTSLRYVFRMLLTLKT